MSGQNYQDERIRWEFEQKRQLAERQHDQENEFGRRIFELAVEGANKALWALLLVNGSAVIALLAFIAQIASSGNSVVKVQVASFGSPLGCFAWGVAVATLASGLAYLTNYATGSSSVAKLRLNEHPYIQDTKLSKRWQITANIFHVITVAIAFISLGLFILGIRQIELILNGLS